MCLLLQTAEGVTLKKITRYWCNAERLQGCLQRSRFKPREEQSLQTKGSWVRVQCRINHISSNSSISTENPLCTSHFPKFYDLTGRQEGPLSSTRPGDGHVCAMLSLGEMSTTAEVLWDRREKATKPGVTGGKASRIRRLKR